MLYGLSRPIGVMCFRKNIMNVATLRTSGTDADLGFLKNALDLTVDREWKRGESRRTGRVNAESGFNADIADEVNPDTLNVCSDRAVAPRFIAGVNLSFWPNSG